MTQDVPKTLIIINTINAFMATGHLVGHDKLLIGHGFKPYKKTGLWIQNQNQVLRYRETSTLADQLYLLGYKVMFADAFCSLDHIKLSEMDYVNFYTYMSRVPPERDLSHLSPLKQRLARMNTILEVMDLDEKDWGKKLRTMLRGNRRDGTRI